MMRMGDLIMKKSMNLERKKMDNHYVFTEKCFEKLLSCFSDGDEITAFLVEYKNLFSITFKLSEELHGPELSDKEQTMILFKMLVSILCFLGTTSRLSMK
jgi:hypothetical protein